MKTIVMTMVIMMAASQAMAAGVTDHIKKHRNLNAADISSEVIRTGSNKAYVGIKNYHVRNKADNGRAEQYANVQIKPITPRSQKRRP